RSMPYSDVGIKNGDPSGVLDAQKYTSSGYLVEYSITWTEATKRTKQIKVSVFKSPMKNKIEVITEITDLGEILVSASSTTTSSTTTSSSTTTTTTTSTTTTTPPTTTIPPTTTTLLPAPQNLVVVSDLVDQNNKKRTVILGWNSPSSPPYGINHYNVYRDDAVPVPIGTVISSSSTINYTDSSLHKDYTAHTYYVTVTYTNGVESGPSNSVTTTPTNL
ncbi:MAG: hypothetical protein ACYDIA_03975, partial [Candidatus Humimicrobiaceae bacterium]